MSMHREKELVQSGPTEGLGGGNATPWEVLWHTEWASSMATSINIQTQASE